MIPKIDLDISNSLKKGRVVVAMSGGVDSSVAAALAKSSGYDTIGVTLQLYDSGSSPKKKGSCCAGQDIHDAKKVASSLNIPHYVLDYEKIFKKKVIDDFALSYERGETPIPCVLCNEKVKFDDLFKVAKDLDGRCISYRAHIYLLKKERWVEKCIEQKISIEIKVIFYLKRPESN